MRTPACLSRAAAPVDVPAPAGKSSLLNAMCGEERVIVCDLSGTTRDAVDTVVTLPSGQKLKLIDTAGIRKRTKVRAGGPPLCPLGGWGGGEGRRDAPLCRLLTSLAPPPRRQQPRRTCPAPVLGARRMGARHARPSMRCVCARVQVAGSKDGAEQLSVERALRAMRRAEVVVAVLDASEGITQQVRATAPQPPAQSSARITLAARADSEKVGSEDGVCPQKRCELAPTTRMCVCARPQDFRLTELAAGEGCAVVLVVNKWDKVDGRVWTQEKYREDVQAQLRHVGWADVVCTTASRGEMERCAGLSLSLASPLHMRPPQRLRVTSACPEMA